jgi:hypothetical protein
LLVGRRLVEAEHVEVEHVTQVDHEVGIDGLHVGGHRCQRRFDVLGDVGRIGQRLARRDVGIGDERE